MGLRYTFSSLLVDVFLLNEVKQSSFTSVINSLLPHLPIAIGLHLPPFVTFSKFNLFCHYFFSNLRFQKSPALYFKFLLSASISPTWINRRGYWLVGMINFGRLGFMPHQYTLWEDSRIGHCKAASLIIRSKKRNMGLGVRTISCLFLHCQIA